MSGLLLMLFLQTSAQQEFFETRVRPVIAQQCYACHTDEKMGGLRLDSKEGLAKVVVPGDPEKSIIYHRMNMTGLGRMPHIGSRVVDEAATKLIHDWIKQMPGE